MDDIINKDKITAIQKASEEAKKSLEDAQAQYAKAEALYNKAKAATLSIQSLALGTSNVGNNVDVNIVNVLNSLSPEEKVKEVQKYKDEAKKLERKAQQELEKAKKALDGAKKRTIIIQEQLNTLVTQKTLKEKSEQQRALSKSKIKNANKKVKLDKAKLKVELKKTITVAGPIAIVFTFGKILNIYVTRLSDTVSQLSTLVDNTNNTIQAATTKADIQKAKVSRDAALATLSAAEEQVNGFRRVLETMSRVITTINVLLNIASSLPTSPYQLATIGIIASRIIAKFTPVLLSLDVLLQVSQLTLNSFLTSIAYERSRLLPLNSVLEQADAQNLTPEEVRDLIATSFFNTGLGPIEGVVYNGFTFSILEEDNPKFVVAGNKRRYAVALDRSGFVVLQSTPSFTLDPNVLIEELKLEIDKRNLEA